jgi:hypothetical protein
VRSLLLTVAALLLASAVARAGSAPAPSPSPAAREALGDAWWTGPLLAPSAGTLPRGHLLVEPYLYDVIGYGSYDRHGNLTPAPHSNEFGSLTYVIAGVTDRFAVGVIPTFGYTTSAGVPNGSAGIGDWALLAQYRIAQYRTGSWIPTTSIALQENFPTGRYDNLGAQTGDGLGAGAYSTKASLYTQTYFWLGNGRIVRARLNFSDTFSGHVPVDGVSVYGTGANFHGTAAPGNEFSVDAAAEYSATRNWVLAGDAVYGYGANTRLTSPRGVLDLGDVHTLALAPALEYNWSANAGVIAGFRIFPTGRNAGASFTPVAAINLVY